MAAEPLNSGHLCRCVTHRTFETKPPSPLLPSSNRSLGIIMFEVASIAYDRASMHGYFDPSRATVMMSSSGKTVVPAQRLTSKNTSTKSLPKIRKSPSPKTKKRRPASKKKIKPPSNKKKSSSRRRNSENQIRILYQNSINFQDYGDTSESITWSHPSYDLQKISCKET